MKLFRRKSDREIVDELRRTERYRRPLGLALIVLGLAYAGFTAWRVKWIERKTLAIVAHTDPPISPELHDVSAALAYTMGLHAGLSVTQGAFFSAVFLAGGIRLRFGGRKGRLLIRLFDLATNTQGPPDPRTQA
jgi:hypothetical protein